MGFEALCYFWHPRYYGLGRSSWKEVDIITTKLNEWNRRMELRYGFLPPGFLILDPKDRPVGVWCSSIVRAVVKMEKGNPINVLLSVSTRNNDLPYAAPVRSTIPNRNTAKSHT
jgi:hypothetical protein